MEEEEEGKEEEEKEEEEEEEEEKEKEEEEARNTSTGLVRAGCRRLKTTKKGCIWLLGKCPFFNNHRNWSMWVVFDIFSH